MKTKTFPILRIVLFGLLSSSLILAASERDSSKSSEHKKSLNALHGKDRDSCYDKQLCSNQRAFYVVSASALAELNKKSSGKGSSDASWMKDMLGVAVIVAAGGNRSEDEETESLPVSPLTVPSTSSLDIGASISTLTGRNQNNTTDHYQEANELGTRLFSTLLFSSKQGYTAADKTWATQDKLWEMHRKQHQELREVELQLDIAKKEEAQVKDDAQHCDESRLGQLGERLQKVALILHMVPELYTQGAAIATGTASDFLSHINKIWTQWNLVCAVADRQKVEAAYNKIKKTAEEANVLVVTSEIDAKRAEEAAYRSEEEEITSLAEHLNIHEYDGEAAWERWSQRLIPEPPEPKPQNGKDSDKAWRHWKEKSIEALEKQRSWIQLGKANMAWVRNETAKAWQRALEVVEEERQQLQITSREHLYQLKATWEEAEQKLQRLKTVTQEAVTRLHGAEAHATEAKKSIEQFVSTLEESYHTWNQFVIDQKRQEFRVQWQELTALHAAFSKYKKELIAAQQAELKQGIETLEHSKAYKHGSEANDRALTRLCLRQKLLQDSLQNGYPESCLAKLPYAAWKLPELPVDVVSKKAAEESVKPQNDEDISPPLQRQRDLIAFGKKLLCIDEQVLATIQKSSQFSTLDSQKMLSSTASENGVADTTAKKAPRQTQSAPLLPLLT